MTVGIATVGIPTSLTHVATLPTVERPARKTCRMTVGKHRGYRHRGDVGTPPLGGTYAYPRSTALPKKWKRNKPLTGERFAVSVPWPSTLRTPCARAIVETHTPQRPAPHRARSLQPWRAGCANQCRHIRSRRQSKGNTCPSLAPMATAVGHGARSSGESRRSGEAQNIGPRAFGSGGRAQSFSFLQIHRGE